MWNVGFHIIVQIAGVAPCCQYENCKWRLPKRKRKGRKLSVHPVERRGRDEDEKRGGERGQIRSEVKEGRREGGREGSGAGGNGERLDSLRSPQSEARH